jgi:hypothetical protein
VHRFIETMKNVISRLTVQLKWCCSFWNIHSKSFDRMMRSK